MKREGNRVEQRRSVDDDTDAGDLEIGFVRLGELFERPVVEPEDMVADGDDVAVVDSDATDPVAVDKRAVVAAQVHELNPTAVEPPELGVVAGCPWIARERQVVVRRAADAISGSRRAMDGLKLAENGL